MLVDIDFDEKMYFLFSNKELYFFIENWVYDIVKDIKELYENGYYIYIIIDYGNVYIFLWRNLIL